VLASASVNRKKILETAGLTHFEVSPSNFAENLPKESFNNSKEYVIATSEGKLHDKIKEI